MALFQLVDFAKNRYNRQTRCPSCTEGCVSCEMCLDDMHFRRTQRRYQCNNISDFYVCKYIYKYGSEIDRLLDSIDIHTRLNTFTSYKVLSIGCGPATELFGFHANAVRNRVGKVISFLGLDFNNVWESIHRQIADVIVPANQNLRVQFNYADGFHYLRNYPLAAHPPNVLLLQYLLSDIQAHTGNAAELVDLIATNVVPTMPIGSVIVANDINHYNARDYFERLATHLSGTHAVERYSFDNNNRQAFQYGTRHADNSILYPVPADVSLTFHPWTFCSSAQMILQKRV